MCADLPRIRFRSNWKRRERNGSEGGSPVLARNQNDASPSGPTCRWHNIWESSCAQRVGKFMSIATDILSLRQNQSGSVRTLMSLLDWQKAAQDDGHFLSRSFAVT